MSHAQLELERNEFIYFTMPLKCRGTKLSSLTKSVAAAREHLSNNNMRQLVIDMARFVQHQQPASGHYFN